MTLARIYLLGMAGFSLLFGLAYLLAPISMVEPAGFGPLSGAATTDVRATYGGFQLGLGAFLLWAAREEANHPSALLLIAFSLGAVFLSRLAGLGMDGELTGFHALGLAIESGLTLATLLIWRKTTALPAA